MTRASLNIGDQVSFEGKVGRIVALKDKDARVEVARDATYAVKYRALTLRKRKSRKQPSKSARKTKSQHKRLMESLKQNPCPTDGRYEVLVHSRGRKICAYSGSKAMAQKVARRLKTKGHSVFVWDSNTRKNPPKKTVTICTPCGPKKLAAPAKRNPPTKMKQGFVYRFKGMTNTIEKVPYGYIVRDGDGVKLGSRSTKKAALRLLREGRRR